MMNKYIQLLLVTASFGSVHAYVENRSVMGTHQRALLSLAPFCIGSAVATQLPSGKAVMFGAGVATSAFIYFTTAKNKPGAVYDYARKLFNQLLITKIDDYNVEQISQDLRVLKSLFEKLMSYEQAEHFATPCQKYISDIAELLNKCEKPLQALKLNKAIRKLESLVHDPLLGNFGYSSLDFDARPDQEAFVCRQMGQAFGHVKYPFMKAEEHMKSILQELETLRVEFAGLHSYEQMVYLNQIDQLSNLARQRIMILQMDISARAERARYEEEKLYQQRLEYERRLARERAEQERIQLREEARIVKHATEAYEAEQRAQKVLAEQLALEKEIERKKNQEASDRQKALNLQALYDRQTADRLAEERLRNQVKERQEREAARQKEEQTRKDRDAVYNAEQRAKQVLAEQLAVEKQIQDKKTQEERDRKLATELQARYDREEAVRKQDVYRQASAREKEEREAKKRLEQERLKSEVEARRVSREQEVQQEMRERQRKEADIEREKKLLKSKKDRKEQALQKAQDDALDGLNDFFNMVDTQAVEKKSENKKPEVDKSELVAVQIPECAICLESLAEGKVTVLNCNDKIKHAFHTECIKTLTTCPHCRKPKSEFMKSVSWKEVEASLKTKEFQLPG